MNPAEGAVRVLWDEHGVLLRRLAHLQHSLGAQLEEAARRQAALEAQNLRLRAELVCWRTATVWGLPVQSRTTLVALAGPRPALLKARGMREAQAVLCQTGCVGHAHPWLEDGHCRQTGQACDRLQPVEPTPAERGAPGTG